MKSILICALLSPYLLAANETNVLKSAADLNHRTFGVEDVGRPFVLSGHIIAANALRRPFHFYLTDETGAVRLSRRPSLPASVFRAGNTVRIFGHVIRSSNGLCSAQAERVEILGSAKPSTPVETDALSILLGRHSGQLVRFRGTVKDIRRDDIDPNWTVFTVFSGNETISASLCTDRSPTPDATRYLGAEVSVTGFCKPLPHGHRHFLGSTVDILDLDGLRVLTAPPSDPFNTPSIDTIDNATPRNLLALGYRSVTGRILATWDSNKALIRTLGDNLSQISFTSNSLPQAGAVVDVCGFPHTDLYNINLSHALWRHAAAKTRIGEQVVEDISAAQILTSPDGRPRVQTRYHGRTIRLCGDILTLPAAGSDNGILRLRNGSFIIPVNATSCPHAFDGLTVGCHIQATGICTLLLDDAPSIDRIPSFKGFMLVIRRPQDIKILARPPWWTPARLIAVIGTLLAVLLGIGIWNLMLRRLAERRGRELAAENVARAESDLRVYERTRLAVELHDSIAQNLSGVSLELDAAKDFVRENPAEMERHLDIAARTLKSCRGELRNCMWDLRNQTLEDERMDDAIHRTLAPHLGDTRLAVRFAVPRERLSDNTALAILRIIRELTLNAIRHGSAKSVQVAGCVEDGKLMFSVRDDGCGFNPENRPGIEEGHFGLQGVSERIESFDGELAIDSAPGQGAKVTVVIPVPGGSAESDSRT